MDERPNKQMNAPSNEWTNKWTNKQVMKRIKERMNETANWVSLVSLALWGGGVSLRPRMFTILKTEKTHR